MERYFGFDLGDAESAVSVLEKDSAREPEVLQVGGTGSFITAWARKEDMQLVIGEPACYLTGASERKLRFKSRFLTDPGSERDVKQFAKGVLSELVKASLADPQEDCCFYIGCPVGWDKNARERYRSIFEAAGYPPVRIISESRAALVSACQSRHLQVGYDILSHPVLVVDIGSSTTDFAYIMGGREVELQTGGESFLGGGQMDELLLDAALEASDREKELRGVFEKSEPWRTYCEFAARRLKEKYFSDEAYWQEHGCMETIRVFYDRPLSLTLRMNREMADRILYRPCRQLSGRSFAQVFRESLKEVRDGIDGKQPELLFLTGGVSRLGALRDWCREVFPEAVVITARDPEFSVSKGLAWCGSIDEEMRAFTKEITDLKDSSTVEQIVERHVQELYKSAVETLTEPILRDVVLPVIYRWRGGAIRRLSDIDEELQREITAWMHSETAHSLLVGPVTSWLKPVAYELEEHTVPICVRHHVPYRALSLNSYLNASDLDIRVEAKSVFAIGEITWMIDTIISILIGLLCGGGGIALITGGLPGIIAGAVISLLVLVLGKDRMEDVLLKANLPVAARKLFPKSYFSARMNRISDEVKQSFYETLEKDKNEEITERLVRELSGQIEDCLIKMARTVEIPLV